MIIVFVFFLGAVIGSFLNVCIYRIPAGESILYPGSRCPACRVEIRWFQNIPIISYLFLRGSCASCSAQISPRYPMVEALTGTLFILVFLRFEFNWATPVYWLFTAALVTITFIDLDHQIIPDAISLPGIPVGFACTFLLPWISWVDSLAGILLGGGSLYLVATGYELITKREGMGGGDIKFLAMIGAFLGWKAILPVIFLSSIIGSFVGGFLMLAKKTDSRLAIPFGPFLSLGTVIYLLFGSDLARWYFSLL